MSGDMKYWGKGVPVAAIGAGADTKYWSKGQAWWNMLTVPGTNINLGIALNNYTTLPLSIQTGFNAGSVYFSDFKDANDFLDWSNISNVDGVNYVSIIETFYHAGDDTMFWMGTPYVYTFMRNQGERDVFDEEGEVTGTVPVDGLNMIGKWDWKD